MMKPGPLWRCTVVHKFKQRRFQLDIKEKQFPIRMVKHQNKGPERQGNLCPCRFSRLDWKKPWAPWSEFIADAILSRTLDERPSKVPSNMNCSMILSSKGLQCQRSNNWQRSICSVGYVVVTDLHVGLEIHTAKLSGPDILKKYALQCNSCG